MTLEIGGGRTIEELKKAMSYREFLGWKRRYKRDPWGSAAADSRYSKMISLLQNLVNMKAKTPIKLKTSDLFVSKFVDEYNKTRKLLYTNEKAPWLEIGQTPEELALEGQAIFKDHEKTQIKRNNS